MKDYPGIFIENVLKLLDKLDWSQADLARHAHISKSTLGAYLKRKKEPGIAVCARIAGALGVDLSDLFSASKTVEAQPQEPSVRDLVGALTALDNRQLKKLLGFAIALREAKTIVETSLAEEASDLGDQNKASG